MPPDELVQRYDFTRLDLTDKRTTPSGGIIAKARISKVGILEYTNADGTTRRELRLPTDVFAKKALDSFAGATVTELHPGQLVTPLSWRQVAVGHLGDTVTQDGDFAAADIHFEHAGAILKVESGENKELSCGYQCKIDATPGVHATYGRYDCRQYDHVGNHVAVGPPGWGRSGSQVALRLDGGAAVSGIELAPYVPVMPPDPPAPVVIPPVATPPVATNTDADRLRGENAALTAANARLTKDAKDAADAAAAGAADERNDAAIDERVALIDAAKPHLDAKDKPWSHKGKSADTIRREVLAKLEPGLELPEPKDDAAGGWISGAFGVAVSRAVRATKALGRTVLASPKNERADTNKPAREEAGATGTGDMIADAADASFKKKQERWKQPKADRASGGRR